MAYSPFPGMDPYLEAPDLWPDVHNRLMNIFAEQLAPTIAPNYVAELNTQVVIERIQYPPPNKLGTLPDVAITRPTETTSSTVLAPPIASAPLQMTVPMSIPTRLVSVYIRLRKTDRLITVIELLSPVNKRSGSGRQDYLEKRISFLDTPVHFVEIDLLRQWERMPLGGTLPKTDYLAVVCKGDNRPNCDVWPISVRDALPVLPIPLQHPDPPVPLDMGQALKTAYQRARYDLRIDYTNPPTPPLDKEDIDWATDLIKKHTEAV